jgi:TP901 family phage tail tape measure protein
MSNSKITFPDAFIDPNEFGGGINKLVAHIDKLEGAFNKLGQNIETGAKAKILELQKAIKDLNIVEKDAQKELQKYQELLNKAASANSELNQKVKEHQEQLKKAKKEVEELQKAYDKLSEGTVKLKKNKDGLSKSTKRSEMGMLEMVKTYLRTTVVVTLLYQALRDVRQGLSNAFASMVEFEKNMKQVEAVTSATATEIQRLTDQAKQLGATTEFTASQISNLQKELGKLGFTAQEIISATGAITDLATATGEDLVTSGRIAAATLRAFSLEASDTSRITDAMAGSFVRSGLNLESFAQSMKFVAPVANQLNVDVETTTVLLSKLADAGLKGTQAGTSLRNIMSDLANPTSKLAQRLEFTVGNSEELIEAFTKLSEEGLNFADITGLVDLTARQQFATFIKQAVTMKDLQKEYRDLEFEGKRLAFMMRDTLANDMEITQSALDALGRGFFSFLDGLGGTDKTASNFRKFQQDIGGYLQRLANQFDSSKSSMEQWAGASAALVLPVLDSIITKLATTIQMLSEDNIPLVGKQIGEWLDPLTKSGVLLDAMGDDMNNLLVATNKSAKATQDYLQEVIVLQEELDRELAQGRITEDSDEYKLKLLEIEEVTEGIIKQYNIAQRQLNFLDAEIGKIVESTDELTVQQENNIKTLKNQYQITLAVVDTYLNWNKALPELVENLKKKDAALKGVNVVDYDTKIAHLKATTESYITTLEKEAQFNDKTLVQQAQTAQKIAEKRISTIREETDLRLKQLAQTAKQRSETVSDEQKEIENAKAQAAITRIQIGLQNELRQIRQRQADLTNREILAELNLELRRNQVIKDNILVAYKDRIASAKDFYANNTRLITTNEDRELRIVQQKFEDNLINQEAFEVEVLEIKKKYAEQRLANSQRSLDEIFKLEQEDFNRRLKIRREFEQLALNDQQSQNKVNELEIKNRLRLIDIDLKATKYNFSERKKLLEEQQNLELRLALQRQQLETARAKNDFDNKVKDLRQQLVRREIDEQEFERLRQANLLAHSNRIKEINLETSNTVAEIQTNTGIDIREAWAQTFQEIADFAIQITDNLFAILDQKRQGELASLKKWEDARLEYVKGNAEAEALVRLEAERKRVEIEKKQAKDARKKALFDIAINTAVAISRVPRDGTFIAAPVQIAALIALGAAQAAAVLSAPLPEFAKGTKNAPEGYARVDERGQELIYRKKQRKYELGNPSGDRITYLQRGDQVFTAQETKKILRGDDTILPNQNIFNKVVDVKSVPVRATNEDKIIAGVGAAIKSIVIEQTSLDERGFSKFLKNKSSRTQLLNKRYKF